MNTTLLSGINFYKGTYLECLEILKNRILAKEGGLIVTPNPEMLYEASRDHILMKVLQNADYALPDGAGIFVGYEISGSSAPRWMKYFLFPLWCAKAMIHDDGFTEKYGERITGSRLTKDMIRFADENKIPVTIIDPIVHGNSPGDNAKRTSQENMQSVLQEKYPNLHITVIVSDTVPEMTDDFSIVFATHGNGKQEKLLSELTKKYHNTLAFGVGGSIDLLTGFRSPAPDFFRRFGGEWLYRLMKNPKRHWKRMKKVMNFLFNEI